MAPFKIPKKNGSHHHPLAVSPLDFKRKTSAGTSHKEAERIKRARTEMLARAPDQYNEMKMQGNQRLKSEKEERRQMLIKSKENAMKKFKENKMKEEEIKSANKEKAKEEAKLQRRQIAEKAEEDARWREARKTCEKDIECMEEFLQVNVEDSEMEDLMASAEQVPQHNEMSELLAAVEKLSTNNPEDPPQTLTMQQEPAIENMPIIFHTMNLGTSTMMITEIPAEQEKMKKLRCFKCRGRNHLATNCQNPRWKDLKKVQKATGVSLFKKTLSKKMMQLVPPPPAEWEDVLTF